MENDPVNDYSRVDKETFEKTIKLVERKIKNNEIDLCISKDFYNELYNIND